MNVQQFWAQKTNELLPQLGNMQAAWRQAERAYPDAVILIRGTGAPRQQVIQFCNSRILPTGTPHTDNNSRRQMRQKIEEEMKSHHCNYGTAFNRVAPQFANAEPDPKQILIMPGADGVPVLGPQLRACFRLPPDTTQTEWASAWKANLEKTFPINFCRVFDAICEVIQKARGMDYEAAMGVAKSRFADLWAMCEQMSKSVL